ncbi:hypothetical protein [Streptomyces sp. NPDC059398]|uniref:hypothetical protein n=1 Tax=Streptomyces sp. NPDC059398 TaxID=3346820 RepID=UPI0036CE829D
MNRRPKVALAFVHHANQLIIGDGYAERDGLSRICLGYEEVLSLHRAHGIPAALHLSGTLIEALAWHRPRFLDRTRQSVVEGWLSLLGGPYAEPILPLLTPAAGRRQLIAMADLLERHLHVPGGSLRTAWLPERVWNPTLVPVLTDSSLPGGGYRRTLVDDRLLTVAPGHGHPAGEHRHFRAAVDRRGPYEWNGVPPSQSDIADLIAPELAMPRRLRCVRSNSSPSPPTCVT